MRKRFKHLIHKRLDAKWKISALA